MEHKNSEYLLIVVLLVGVFVLSLQSLGATSSHPSQEDTVGLQSITEPLQPNQIEHGSLINATLFLAGPFQFDEHDDPRIDAFVGNMPMRMNNYASSYDRGQESNIGVETNEEMLTEPTTSNSAYTVALKANSTSFNNSPGTNPLFSLFVQSLV